MYAKLDLAARRELRNVRSYMSDFEALRKRLDTTPRLVPFVVVGEGAATR